MSAQPHDLTATDTTPAADEDLTVLTVDEAAAMLRISRGLAFAAVRAGTIPYIRIGRRILVPRALLSEMLRGKTAQIR